MPNQEITTALRNSVERGESLQTAMQIMINSGYNPKEVQEASRYISGAPVNIKTKPEEQLTMPEKKSFFSRFKRNPIKTQQPIPQQPVQQTKPVQQPQLLSPPPQTNIPRQEARQIKQQISEPKPIIPQVEISAPEEKVMPLTKQLNKLTPKKHGHGKEIILLIILLILIGLLIGTIFLKETIVGWFS